MKASILVIAFFLLNIKAFSQGSQFPAVINTHHIVISGKALVQPAETTTYTAYFLHPEDIRPVEWIITDGTIVAQNVDPSSGPVYVTVQWKSQTGAINYNIPWGTVYLRQGTAPSPSLAYEGAMLEAYPGIYWNNGTSIYPQEQTVNYGQPPCLLTALADPFNAGSGYYVYRWEQQDNITFQWNTIPGATGATYQPLGLIEPTCFRRVTELWSGPTLLQYEESRGVWVYLYDPLNAGTLYTTSFNVPYNGRPEIIDEMPYGGYCNNLGYLYRWEISYNYRSWETIGTTLHYSTNGPAFTKKNTRIRRGVRCGFGPYIYSNILEFSMIEDIQPDEARNYTRENSVLVKGIESRVEAYQLPTGQRIQNTVYYDGIGRSVQSVSKQTGTPDPGNPTVWQDLVGIKSYDEAGREVKQYLQFPSITEPGKFKTAAATEQPAYYANPSTYNETLPYSQITYENSPLSRGLTVKLPGTAWAASNGNIIEYDFNDVTENVQMWTIDFVATAKPVTAGAYPTGRLQKNTLTDDKGKQVIEYSDINGRLILKKVQKNDTPLGPHAGWLCTYNVYDDLGRLRVIITPEATNFLDNNAWSFTTGSGPAIFDGQCYIYFYDGKDRIVEKKTPGSEKISVIYDSRNRAVFTQTGNQRDLVYQSSYQWVFTLYDNLDRQVATGLLNTSSNYSRENLRDLVDPLMGDNNVQVTITTNTSETITAYNQVTSGSFCTGCTSAIQSVYYYDNYNFSGKKNFDNDFDNYTVYPLSEPNVNAIVQSARTLSMRTGGKVRVLGSSTFLASTAYFDESGRLIQSLEDNIKTGVDAATIQYHFDGRIMSAFTKHNAPGTVMSNFRTLTKNVYDVIGRLTEVHKKYGTAGMKQISAFVYDELGRLKTNKLGVNGSNPVETLDYSYNLHGTLTGINKDYALKKDWNIDPTKKWQHFFGIYLGYDNRDNLFTTPRLDGKLTGVIWNTQGDDAQRRYNYEYDNVGQLVNAAFTQREKITDSWNTVKADFSVSGYTNKIEYDLNGNILSLLNKGIIPGSAPLVVDDLRYTYTANTNKLLKVQDVSSMGANNGKLQDFTDGSNGSNDDYDYDKNGNLVIDRNKDIKDLAGYVPKGIRYNYLDKIEEVNIANKGTITYVYDAVGNKLQKIFTPSGGGTALTTSYIGNFVYEGTDLQFINFGEGRLRVIDPVNQNNTLDYLLIDGNISLPGNKAGVFDYFIKDHLGSMRMTVTEEIHSGKNTCTMETSRASVEEPLFGQIDQNQAPVPGANEVQVTRYQVSNIPPQNPADPHGWMSLSGTSQVSRLTALIPGRKLGPNAILKVMAGDVVNAGAKYYYQNDPGGVDDVSNIVNELLTAFSGVFNSLNVNPLIKAGGSSVTGPLSIPLHNYLDDHDNNVNGKPKAYLTVLFFDEQFNFVKEACMFDRVSVAGDVTRDPLRIVNAKAPKNGYAFVYLNNESDEYVYFDDFFVEHTRGKIVEENHYYAYGLKIASISSRKLGSVQNGKLKNIYGFQGVFSEENELTGWNEFALRDYDAQIGRWLQSDPFDEFASGYIGMGNDPANFTDASGGGIFGGLPAWQSAVAGGIVGASVGILAQAILGNDGDGDMKGAGIGFAVGALIGFGLDGGFGAELPPVKVAANVAVSAAGNEFNPTILKNTYVHIWGILTYEPQAYHNDIIGRPEFEKIKILETKEYELIRQGEPGKYGVWIEIWSWNFPPWQVTITNNYRPPESLSIKFKLGGAINAQVGPVNYISKELRIKTSIAKITRDPQSSNVQNRDHHHHIHVNRPSPPAVYPTGRQPYYATPGNAETPPFIITPGPGSMLPNMAHEFNINNMDGAIIGNVSDATFNQIRNALDAGFNIGGKLYRIPREKIFHNKGQTIMPKPNPNVAFGDISKLPYVGLY